MLSRDVYGGYILEEGTSIWQFQREFNALATAYVYEERTRWLTNKTIFEYDKVALGMPVPWDTELYQPGGDLFHNSLKYVFVGGNVYNRTMRQEYKNLNPRATVLQDEDTGRLYVHLLSDSPFEVKFQQLPYVKFYGWWDNTDKEEGVSPEEWSDRKIVWEKFKEQTNPDWMELELENIGFTLQPVSDFSVTMLLADSSTGLYYYSSYLEQYKNAITIKSPAERAKFLYSFADIKNHVRNSQDLTEAEDIINFISSKLEALNVDEYCSRVANLLVR